MKVLIADDDVLVRYALCAVLGEHGYDVKQARDGAEVIAAVSADPPDLLVLDLMMPKVNGFDVLRWLREADPDRTVTVIILSAFTVEDGGLQRYPHVVDVLQKPLYIDRLLEAVARCRRPAALAA
jgi:two-component system response regulator MprA